MFDFSNYYQSAFHISTTSKETPLLLHTIAPYMGFSGFFFNMTTLIGDCTTKVLICFSVLTNDVPIQFPPPFKIALFCF